MAAKINRWVAKVKTDSTHPPRIHGSASGAQGRRGKAYTKSTTA